MKIKIYILFLLIVLGCSAKKEMLTAPDYIKWVENPENGLYVKRELGNFMFFLQYKPSDYILLKENPVNNMNASEWQKERNEIDGLIQFNLKIESKDKDVEMLQTGISSIEEYTERIQYFSYDAQHDIFLIDGKDTLPCILYHFERSYNLAPYSNLVLGFKLTPTFKESSNDKILSFDDKALRMGKINFLIKASNITNIPSLKINS